MRIEALFKNPLLKTVTRILYADLPAHIKIDFSRNVTVE